MNKDNAAHTFADWYWRSFQNNPKNGGDPDMQRIVRQAKALQKEGYDLTHVRRVMLAMRESGTNITSLYAVKWRAPDGKGEWYDYATPKSPPIWDGLAIKLNETGELPYRAGS